MIRVRICIHGLHARVYITEYHGISSFHFTTKTPKNLKILKMLLCIFKHKRRCRTLDKVKKSITFFIKDNPHVHLISLNSN